MGLISPEGEVLLEGEVFLESSHEGWLFGGVSPAAKDLMRWMICKDVSRWFSVEHVLEMGLISPEGEVLLEGEVFLESSHVGRLFGGVSPAAKDLMRRMICKDVSRRFSAEQVLEMGLIVGLAGGGGLQVPRDPAPSEVSFEIFPSSLQVNLDDLEVYHIFARFEWIIAWELEAFLGMGVGGDCRSPPDRGVGDYRGRLFLAV